MRERLEDIYFGMDLRLLGLADAFHVNLAPGDFDTLLFIVTLEHRLECTMAQLLVELCQNVVGSIGIRKMDRCIRSQRRDCRVSRYCGLRRATIFSSTTLMRFA